MLYRMRIRSYEGVDTTEKGVRCMARGRTVSICVRETGLHDTRNKVGEE